MLIVLVCSLLNAATLIGLIVGIVTGFIRARRSVVAALTFSPPAELSRRPSVAPLPA